VLFLQYWIAIETEDGKCSVEGAKTLKGGSNSATPKENEATTDDKRITG
jgi:hypothetical protein